MQLVLDNMQTRISILLDEFGGMEGETDTRAIGITVLSFIGC